MQWVKTVLLLCEHDKHLCSPRCFYHCLTLFVSLSFRKSTTTTTLTICSYFKVKLAKLPEPLHHRSRTISLQKATFLCVCVCVFYALLSTQPTNFPWCCWTTKEMNLIFCIKTELLNVYARSRRCAQLRIFIMLFTFDKHMHSHYFDCFYCIAVAIEATHTQTHTHALSLTNNGKSEAHKAMHTFFKQEKKTHARTHTQRSRSVSCRY